MIVGLALLAVIAGIALRTWHIGTKPMWLDEGYSAYAASKGFDFLWQVVPRYETHPPFYYSMLRCWSLLFGDSLVGLRSLGWACGIATIPVAGLATREATRLLRLDEARSGLAIVFALVLAAFLPMLVDMTHQVRPYPVMILVMALQCLMIFRLGLRTRAGQPLRSGEYAAYLVLLALMLWLHNLGVLFAGAMGLAFLFVCARPGWDRRNWIAFIGGHFLVLLLWLPAIAILADQAPTWIKATWLRFPPNNLAYWIEAIYIVPVAPSVVAALALTALAIAAMLRHSEGWRLLGALLSLALLPLAASLLISALISPVFIVRIMTPLGVPALILFAIGAASLRGQGKWLGWGALILLLGQMAAVDINTRRALPPEQWYQVVNWLKARMGPGDMVLTYPNEGSLPFDRAVKDLDAGIPSNPIPVAVPAINVGGWYPTGSRGVVSLPRERLRAISDGPAISRAPTVWLIRMGPWTYDKGDVFAEELGRGRTKVDHLSSGVIDVTGFRRSPR